MGRGCVADCSAFPRSGGGNNCMCEVKRAAYEEIGNTCVHTGPLSQSLKGVGGTRTPDSGGGGGQGRATATDDIPPAAPLPPPKRKTRGASDMAEGSRQRAGRPSGDTRWRRRLFSVRAEALAVASMTYGLGWCTAPTGLEVLRRLWEKACNHEGSERDGLALRTHRAQTRRVAEHLHLRDRCHPDRFRSALEAHSGVVEADRRDEDRDQTTMCTAHPLVEGGSRGIIETQT